MVFSLLYDNVNETSGRDRLITKKTLHTYTQREREREGGRSGVEMRGEAGKGERQRETERDRIDLSKPTNALIAAQKFKECEKTRQHIPPAAPTIVTKSIVVFLD